MRPRSVVMVTPPAVEPLSLREIREHLRLVPEQTEDDEILVGLAATARRLVERRLGVALVCTQYRATWPAAKLVVELPNPPLLEGEGYPVLVESLDVDGVATTVDDETYRLDGDATPARLIFSIVPAGELRVTYYAGLPAGSRIAPQLRSAMLLIVGHLYAHREATTDTAADELPMGVEMLLASESIDGRW
jgi:uncharacterized phiE125 gp8 family phage protein